MRPKTRRRPRIVRALIGTVVLIFSATTAQAQFGFGGRGGGFGGGLESTLDSTQLERFAELLEMDEDQRLVAEDFLASYLTEHSQLVEERETLTENAREEFRETRDRSVWRSVGEQMEKIGNEAETLEKRFLTDLQLLLTETQAERWPVVEREHRRTSTISRGFLSGETVDLVDIVRTVAAEYESEELTQTIESYASDLDRVLVKRNEVYREGMGRVRELFEARDFEAINEAFEDAREAGLRVRDINRRYARQLEPLVPEESRASFEQEVNERSFPRVYRRSYAGRVFSTVDEMDDISADQRERIASIRETYNRQAESVNTRWSKAIEKNELEGDMRSMFRGRRGRGGGDGQPDEIREARDERRTLDEKVAQQIGRASCRERV